MSSSDILDVHAHPGIVSVQTRPAKTLPGIAGVLLALVLIMFGRYRGTATEASLVANLLVVLTSEQQTTPVVNAGSSG